MVQPLTADEATTVAMIRAFDTCQDECNAIGQTIDAAAAALFAQWGGAAATMYRQALSGWMEGFNQVRTALNLLNDSMVTYARTTATTEDDNLLLGSGWALG